MSIYCFKLCDGCGGVEDESGVYLRDDNHAAQYARDVAIELMKGRELKTRAWRLDVYQADGDRVCEIAFASVDPTLDHLKPEQRAMVQGMAERQRSLREVLHEAEATVQETRALLARSRGKPYLASRFGKSIIRA